MSREPIPLHGASVAASSIDSINATSRKSLVRLRFGDGSHAVAKASLVRGLGLADGAAVFPAVRATLLEQEAELARAAAMRLAARSERTSDEIERALRGQGYSPGAIEAAVAGVARVNGVSDERAAVSHVASRTGRRAKSSRMLQQELRQRGVGDQVAAAAVEGVDDDSNALELARGLLRQRHHTDFETFARRTSGFLLRRGYRHGTALNACRTAWNERDDEAT